MKKIIIAIDGHSSCGKSSLAKDLSKSLGFNYVDTGAMYRAVTFFLMTQNIDLDNHKSVSEQLGKINIKFNKVNGNNHVFLNGIDIENEVRSMEVSRNVSKVATISEIRTILVEQQQKMGLLGGLVMDGRDITTIVFPDAEIKIFLTADLPTRSQRRYDELKSKGTNVSLSEIESNLKERDFIDSNRTDSPLTKAEDAIVFDNSYITREEQLVMILALAEIRINQ